MGKRFTLAELIVVIICISILASIVVPNVANMKEEALIAEQQANIVNIQAAVDFYHMKNDSYPATLGQPTLYKMKKIDFTKLNEDYLRGASKIKYTYYVDYYGGVHAERKNPLFVEDYVIYYDIVDNFLLEEISKKDLAILEPLELNSKQVDYLKSKGTITLGYIPIGEVNDGDTEFLNLLQPNDFVYENGVKKTSDGGAYYLDLRSPHYREVLISLMNTRVMSEGFDGVFLDTVANITENTPPEYYEEYLGYYEEILIAFKSQHPDALIMQNRGFDIGVDMSSEYIDALLWENFYATEETVSNSHRQIIEDMKILQEEGIAMFAVSLGSRSDSEIQKIHEYAKKLNYIIYHNYLGSVYNTWPFYIPDEVEYNEGIASELDSSIALGSYVSMGSYNGHPLTWQVIKKNEFGMLLFATEPLKKASGSIEYRPFDSTVNTGENDDENRNRQLYGSNNWERSDLRKWLNTDFYDYFSNFTEDEKENIVETNGKVILAGLDAQERQMGMEQHRYNKDINYIVQNYNVSYSKIVKDKVFLLSSEELSNAYNVIGSTYYSPSAHYWIRDPYTPEYKSRYVKKDSTGVSATEANNTYIGVRPAMYIESGSIKSGNGTLANPYKLY